MTSLGGGRQAEAALPAPPQSTGFDAGALWVAAPLLVLAVCFFYPLGLIAAQAFTGDDGSFSLATAGSILASAQFASALLHTIAIALAASAGCVALGFTLAFIVACFATIAWIFRVGWRLRP